ncbi:MAG: hypothetical protein JKY60_05420 [Kordiimonadaceae bacterium]|nr:hypothetical protein [Kordiimonadaceae bacterium]
MTKPNEIITVLISLKKRIYLRNWKIETHFEFVVDTETPLKGGIRGKVLEFIKVNLKDPKFPDINDAHINDLAAKYNLRATNFRWNPFLILIRSASRISLFLKNIFVGLGFIGDSATPSPFDVGLKNRKSPCYLLYVTNIHNWHFKSDRGGNIMVPTAKNPLPNYENCIRIPQVAACASHLHYGVHIKNIGFDQTTIGPIKYHGYGFDIDMVVTQTDKNGMLHQTPITIDPKIRNP